MSSEPVSQRSFSSINGTKYALCLHTTSPELGLGLSNFKGKSRYQTWKLGRALSTDLHNCLAEFILPQTWSDLSFIAVAKGPGSFTGSRVGVVTARTLAQQFDIPLFAISSLAAIAGSQVVKLSADQDMLIAVAIPAQRSEVSAAVYQVTQEHPGLTPVLPDTSLSIQEWQKTLKTRSSHHQVMQIDEREVSVEDACRALLRLAYQQWQRGDRPHWSEAIPFYSQQPQAQPMPGQTP